jgi:hypothetical protein
MSPSLARRAEMGGPQARWPSSTRGSHSRDRYCRSATSVWRSRSFVSPFVSLVSAPRARPVFPHEAQPRTP